jgi:hypothetical protein
MGRAIGALCVLIVCLQILVGVPVLVCLVLFGLAGGSPIGPLAVEVHTGHDAPTHVVVPHPTVPLVAPTTMGPPPNIIPPALTAPPDNPILISRAEHGSPLAGTVLGETVTPETEQQLFVAAFEKVAAEKADGLQSSQSSPQVDPGSDEAAATAEALSPAISVATDCSRKKASQFAVDHLYAMAHLDEQAGEYDRADQWRSLAREIRRQSENSPR